VKISDFDYTLPPACVATFPTPRRDGSRLLRLGRYDGSVIHLEFGQIAEHLPAEALIVLNDTRVIPARLRGKKPTGGRVELLLIRRVAHGDAGGDTVWEAIGRNLAGAPDGTVLTFAGGLTGEIRGHGEEGRIRVVLSGPGGTETVESLLERVGEVPLPPYIEAARKLQMPPGSAQTSRDGDSSAFDRERYQTVYATEPGAVAAPTAGLHFTEGLLARLSAAGHQIVRLTLHVGLGTFRPVKVDNLEDHQMESESYTVPSATAAAVEAARRDGRPVLAVGTTVVRALESAARIGDGIVRPGTAWTRLFLTPGASFQVVTDLVTNFHLPRSTLLLLVSAFAGRERVLGAYAEAIAAGYRFYSYGDAMLIRGTP
jgi:S-adenosylmethionine:tRNA ribosyltransferase-isomerase